jgi:WD40 repeat protein
MRVLNGPKHEIEVMAFSPDGTRLAVGGSAARVQLWDLDAGQATAVLGNGGPFVSVAFWDDYLIGVVNGGAVRIRELSTGRERSLDSGRLKWITSGVIAPQHSTLILAGGDTQGYTDRYLQGWALPELLLAWTYRRSRSAQDPSALAMSPDGRTLAVGGTYGVTLNDPNDGKTRKNLTRELPLVRRLTFSPDGRRIAAVSPTRLSVWDAESGVELANFRKEFKGVPKPLKVGDEPWKRRGRGKEFTGVAFSPDGRFLAAASADGTVRLFHTGSWSEAAAFDWGIGPVREVVFSPDGMRAAAGGAKGQIVVWDVDV